MQLTARLARVLVAAATVLCLMAGGSALAAGPGEVGTVLYAKGASSARGADGDVRLLGAGAPLRVADTITTGSRSFVLLQFNDGTKITVRPDSVFTVEQFQHDHDRHEAVFNLVKGGLRALTGLISKLNPGGFQVHTPVATLGIRGTEFDARLCAQDCAGENLKAASQRVEIRKLVGRIVLSQGSIASLDATGREHVLGSGAPVHAGDTLITGKDSWAVIAFRDDSRFTLQPQTEFVVQDYNYEPQSPQKNSGLFNLVRGGLRTLTGAIAKINRPGFEVRTPTATIGIRGTGFDTFYRNPVWARVWLGAINFDAKGGTLIVNQGQTVYLPDADAKPELLKQVPEFFGKLPGPRPDQVQVDLERLFGTGDPGGIQPGLWVWVRDGHVQIEGTLDLGAGEAGYANQTSATRLELIPVFLLEDDTPLPGSTEVTGPLSCEVQ